ncbi:MAG: PilC/PilY family type IV pilus protein [Thiobacillaceae bacterium]
MRAIVHHPRRNHVSVPHWPFRAAAQALVAGLMLWGNAVHAGCVNNLNGPCVNNTPLYLGTSSPPNVLMILSNAQNMDENGDPNAGVPIGAAIGGSSPYSKSEVARQAVRNLEASYLGQINMGLMSFAQNAPASNYYIYNSLYDASYDPANYAPPPPYQAKNSSFKNYRITNPVDPLNFIYYNWASSFYDTGLYPANFCYSATAKFDNTTNITSKDTYRCFWTKTGTSDGNSPLGAGGSANATEQGWGYSGNLLYQGYFVPTDSDYATNTLDFGARIPSLYVSTTWFNNGSPGKGTLNVPIAALNAGQQTTINNKLTCNVPKAPANAPNPNPVPLNPPFGGGACNTNSASSIFNAGLTPIDGTLQSAKTVFTSATGNGGGSVPNSCGKNFTVLLTNGLPSVNSTGSVPKLGNGQVDVCTLTSQAVASAQALKTAGVDLYVVGYAMLPQVLANYTSLCGNATNPLDQMAAAGGTSSSYSASNPTQLNTALSGVFNSILQSSGSSSALTSNSTSISSNTYVYEASFNTVDWSGELQAFKVTNSGVSNTPSWSASSQIPAAGARNIRTWDGSNGQLFQWGNLSTNEQCYLAGQAPGCVLTAAQITSGQNVLAYLRGDKSLEQKQGGTFRDRSTPLGDIVDSNPLYLSNEDYGYSVLPGGEGTSYSTYVQAKAGNMIYVGANDGMLHAFNAATGVESWAYVPSTVYAHLADLSTPAYNGSHEYFVDGSAGSGDAYYAGSWHTILLGTLGATSGANAVFALDISNPGSLNNGNVKWEFTDANDLGQTWGEGAVARFNDGHYYAVVNNGYNSVNKHAVLFLVQVDNPGNVIKLDTGVGSALAPNGLSQPALLDADHNGTIDAIYAGDLQGDVWKFDVSSSIKANWQVGYAGQPLFVAKDSLGNRQPITAPLALGSLPSGASGTVMVFVGTGQYLNNSDLANTATQSLYGVLDRSQLAAGSFVGGTSNFTRSTMVGGNPVMVMQDIDTQGATRGVTSNAVNYAGGNLGWYMDLLNPPFPPGTQKGERVISQPVIQSGRVIFMTLIPAAGQCAFGGSGWAMELDAATGGAPSAPFLDYNNDGTYDSVTLSNGSSSAAVGVAITSGFGHTPVSMTNGNQNMTVFNTSSGNTGSFNTSNPTGSPRASWSQIQ